MTTKKAAPARAREAQRERGAMTVLGAWSVSILEMLEDEHRIKFPSSRYRQDPVGFFREILGVEPWETDTCGGQVEVLEAVCKYDRVAWKSGRRVAKSHTAAGLALWFYCCWEYARVIMTSTTARQVDAILWRQLSMMRARAGRCVSCVAEDPMMLKIPKPCPHSARIDGDIGMLARTGLKSEDDLFREVWGFTASEAEAVQGLAGPRMFFIVDEASGVPEPIYEAIDGNAAGGAKILLTGNPTRTSGRFFDAFNKSAITIDDTTGHAKKDAIGWYGITTSSEESPNITSGTRIDGLATAEWIREREHEWGRGSPLFRVHVEGEFATNEDGKIFSIDKIRAAELRHAAASDAGRLFIGLDPAGETGQGDDTCFTPRRGLKAYAQQRFQGLNEDGHLARLLVVIEEYSKDTPNEIPVVVTDRSGKLGADLYQKLRVHAHEIERTTRRAPFVVIGVRYSDKARNPFVYDTMRDELAGNLEKAFRDGAAIVEDTKLSAELHVLEWKIGDGSKLKVTPKTEIRKELGRSPDGYDSLSLSFWEPLSLQDDVPDTAPRGDRSEGRRQGWDDDDDDDDRRAESRIDPYGRR